MYDHGRWGIAFLVADARLTDDDRLHLLVSAISMYLNKEEERKLCTINLEGILYNTGKRALLGSFAGQRFEAELETNAEKSYPRFLITEHIDARLN